MSLVFAAITPHSPILIPEIGKNNIDSLKNTTDSLEILEDDLIKSGTETIIIISPHGEIESNSFSLNLSPEFILNFEDFGNFSISLKVRGDIGLAHKIRESLETKAPLQMITKEKLDHGSSVPFYLLTKKLPNIKIIPIYYSGLDNNAHFKFGQLLKQEIISRNDKIAVIASGNLSHRLNEDSPAGFSPQGKKFDEKLTEFLVKNNPEGIINLDSELTKDAGECGLKSILILEGIISNIKHDPKILSYESPFGVGFLTMNFKL